MQTFDIAVGSLVQRELISNFYFGYIYISIYFNDSWCSAAG